MHYKEFKNLSVILILKNVRILLLGENLSKEFQEDKRKEFVLLYNWLQNQIY